MSLPPRNSPRFHNLQFTAAWERIKEQIHYAMTQYRKDGFPPLTEKLTLTKLRKMEPDAAVAELQAELRRTMKTDELTGAPIPDNETIKLIKDYMAQGAA